MSNIILSVISSWQVLVATIALVIYISLVRYVSRENNRRFRPAPAPKAKKEKADAKAKPAAAAPSEAPKTDELGLEEENVPVDEE